MPQRPPFPVRALGAKVLWCHPARSHAIARSQINSKITSASPQMLVQSGNPVYALLREQNINLAASLDAQKQIVAALLAARASANPGPSDFPQALPTVDSVPFIQQEKRGNIKFYHLQKWEAHFQAESRVGYTPHKLGFLEDKNGNPVSPQRRHEIVRGANAIFNTLYHERQDPHTWGKKLQPVAKYYYVQMRLDFPEFRYCDGGEWKAEKFASLKYSDWCKDTRSKGNLTCRNKSIQNGAPALVRPPRKKAKVSQPRIVPKLEPECIDLSTCNATPPLTFPTSPSRMPTPILPPTMAPPAMPPSTSTPSSTTSPISTPSGVSSATSSQLMVATPSAVTTNPTVPIAPASTPTSPDGINGKSNVQTDSQPQWGISFDVYIIATPTSGSAEPRSDLRSVPPRLKPRKQVNPLAGLSIPSAPLPTPAMLSIDTNAPRTTTPDQLDAPTDPDACFPKCNDAAVSAKRSAPVKPSEAQTARNLYCVDYLKIHPTTTAAEFKVVWDTAVPDAVKQSYNPKSHINKSKGKAMTDSN
ncbi:hypothetical protein BDN71DRAFT_1432982 [Pleurotus eryngii]|uniref:Uncharacterized protein n=1 Tax=Pleurotus eryngii TaxID=5323 RepID=A0A9P5ZS56_PLEER|nr:hypothetical protein BDN71DRAFT_1432982 [Pleurotus eryngii]